MQVTYTVHSANIQDFQVEIVLNGKTVNAAVPGLVVELVSTDGTMSHTLKYMPDDVQAALAEFEVGATITATFEAE